MSKLTNKDGQSCARPVADSHDLIRVHGARVNNLKDVSVDLPKRRLPVFTGVSGSGIAAELQRLIIETGLTITIIVDQQRLGGDTRSTVGTATDANAMLRIRFSWVGKPIIG